MDNNNTDLKLIIDELNEANINTDIKLNKSR